MDAVKAFFAKYLAVPATDAGPQWDRATDAALLGWAADDNRTYRANPNPVLASRMREIMAELRRRNEAEGRAGAAVQERATMILRLMDALDPRPLPPEALAKLTKVVLGRPG